MWHGLRLSVLVSVDDGNKGCSEVRDSFVEFIVGSAAAETCNTCSGDRFVEVDGGVSSSVVSELTRPRSVSSTS